MQLEYVDLIQIHDLEFSVSLEQVRIISAMKKTFRLNDSLESMPVLWVRTGFNADTDLDASFYRFRVWFLFRLCRNKKLNSYVENIIYVG